MTLEMDASPSWRRRLFVALGLALVLPGALGAWHLWVNRDRGARVPSAAATPWRREDPAPGVVHLELRGQGYGLGLAEGTAMKAEIREIARFLREDLLGKGVLGAGSRDWLLSTAWKFEAFLAPRYREELRGMSDATGVPYADLLLINTFDDLQHVSGCSSAVVPGTEGQPLLHARNLDYPIARLARVKVVSDIENGGIRIRTFGFPGLIGALTGMSSRGLGLSSHTSASRRNRIGEPSVLLYRRMLEECGSLGQMQAVLEQAHRTMGNNLALSDGPRNRALALEFDAEAVEARQPEQGRLFVTNHFWSHALQRYQSEAWWTPRSGSQARVACLSRALPPGTGAIEETLQKALGLEGPGSAWRTPANRGTVQSVVMEPGTGRAWLATGTTLPVTRGTYLELGRAW